MSNSMLITVIVIAAVVVVALCVGLWMMSRRRRLQKRFGPEYERTVDAAGGRMAAERELRDREARHAAFELRELPTERRHEYAERWSSVQERFVDRPEGSVGEADELITQLMRERGYPTEGFSRQVRDLSVEHGRTLDHYRAAHDVKVRSGSGGTTTEELRGAMVHYRALFDELLDDQRSR
ncbi:hypothetical protein DEJ51_00275 [Streptomyces venezuelae]|uniref:Secreted protein n=1 Tax=Streptomyces venezuelae TaxID=54571 RepID=A0A5P2DEB0_STRVZ|nr:hypothetical protein [Streptomyces venezuelae]QES52900.1 hypothetical protein DEJ51_00275 [Streptomyces venezuelae]